MRLESVTMSYRARDGDYTAVSDVDLTVARGRFVSVVGPTGCGKSTLLNAVAGLLAPASGRVLIDGTPLRGLNRHAGYLFQQDAVLPWKTVLDNVAFGLQLRGVPKRDRLVLARDWIKRVGWPGSSGHTRTSSPAACAGAPPSRRSGSVTRRCC